MDTVPNTFPSLFAGYTAIWIIVSVYVASLGLRLSRLERKLETHSHRHNDAS